MGKRINWDEWHHQRYLYESCGFCLREVGELTNTKKPTVRARLVRMGVKLRPPYPPVGCDRLPPADKAKTVFMYEKMGMSPYEIGRRLGFSEATIRGRLRHAGVTFRTKKQAAVLYQERKARGDTDQAASGQDVRRQEAA